MKSVTNLYTRQDNIKVQGRVSFLNWEANCMMSYLVRWDVQFPTIRPTLLSFEAPFGGMPLLYVEKVGIIIVECLGRASFFEQK
jgi:hypothetical protein